VLSFVPNWLLPWLVVLGLFITLMIVTVLPDAVDGVVLVLAVWGIPLGIIGYRHWTGRDADDDGMPVGRLDSLFRRQ
jgi:hypothetical protein